MMAQRVKEEELRSYPGKISVAFVVCDIVVFELYYSAPYGNRISPITTHCDWNIPYTNQPTVSVRLKKCAICNTRLCAQ